MKMLNEIDLLNLMAGKEVKGVKLNASLGKFKKLFIALKAFLKIK